MANIKKGKSKAWSEEAINTLIHMTTYGMLPVVIIKTKTESLCLQKNLMCQCKNITSTDMTIKTWNNL